MRDRTCALPTKGSPRTQSDEARHRATTACDWCGQQDHDPIKPTDGE